MSFNNSKVQSLINKIKSQILGDIEDKIEEHDVVANSSRTGHVQAGSSPQDINTSGTSNAGTDNGYYARADHIHKIATASTTGKGIVQLDSTPTANSSNGVTSSGISSALQNKQDNLSTVSQVVDANNFTIFNSTPGVIYLLGGTITYNRNTNKLYFNDSTNNVVDFDNVLTSSDFATQLESVVDSLINEANQS